ncbi:MAG: ribonuclease HII, partial [Candidatus Micrarchaeota archaeon]
RGPVIGPLVLCAYAIGEEDEAGLQKIGVKDSKMLSGKERERIAKILAKHPHEICEVSAREITEYMRRKTSLNEMEAEKIASAALSLSAKLAKGVERLEGQACAVVGKIFVDSPDPVPKKFEMRIRKYLRGTPLEKTHIVSENKADSKYLCVGAASILAKSMRERRVAEIAIEVGEDFGTGYPSDERTVGFLRRHHKDENLQQYIRHKWATMKHIKMTDIKLREFF